MAQYNFEGDIDNISERQLHFINSIIEEHGFKNSKVFFEPVGIAGDNYVASVKRITIDGDHGSLKIIAKIAPMHEVVRQTMNTYILFRNEHVMYTEVLPKLVQLQKDADVPEQEQLRFAKCYGSLAEQPNEVILLEDLKTSDFRMLDRFTPLSNDCVISVLKNFAILHSLSFVLRLKEPETYKTFKTSLIDMWSLMGDVEEVKIYFDTLEADTIAIVNEKKYVDILRNKVSSILSVAGKFSKIDDTNNRYTVIQQGDSWTNNIMFRFQGDKLKDSIMIDYQVSKNTSPVCDLMYMIFNCTDHETRRIHFYDWIDYYHSELDKSLSNFNLKANLIYPRDRLDADLKQYGKLLFGLSIILANVLIRKSDDAAKIQDAMKTGNTMDQSQDLAVSSLDNESKTLYKNRIIGLIESFVDLGLL